MPLQILIKENLMKLTTTFWSEKIEEFENLLYINGSTKEIMFQTKLGDSLETYNFFKNIARFVKTKQVLKTVDNICWNNEIYYQFAVQAEDKIIPIKWFDLVINEKVTISHDIAFETTLINKNGLEVPFGKFPLLSKRKYSKYREFNIKSRAYKYIANQIQKNKF